MNPLKIDRDRYTKPTTDAPHELAGAVNLIQRAGLLNEQYDYPYWLKKVREANFDPPEEEIRRLLEKLKDLEAYLWGKKSQVMTNKGGWLTNRLKEEARGPQPRN